MRRLLIIVITLLAITTPGLAQPAPPDHGSGTDAECATYGCLFAHDRCRYTRGGEGGCWVAYGVAHQRLPDGPDQRRFERVLWPTVVNDTTYDPSRRAAWDRLAGCESGHRWHINNGNGYHGGLQFHPRTWTAYGGGQFAQFAYNATPEQQIAVAERVLGTGWGQHRPQGRGAWPGCLRKGQGAPHPMARP